MDSPPGTSGVFPHIAAPSALHPVPYGVEIANRVFVGGCPYDMTELQLMQFFSKFGEVKDAKIITDREGGKSRGYGFVTFATEEQAAQVYSKGSIYYEQKKLNVSKAIRKYGGQYQKANQEYVNGQQRLVWLHPNGCLVTQQEAGWQMEHFISHSQAVKPCYPLPPPPPNPPALYYGHADPYMSHSHAGHVPMYGYMYNYGPSYPASYLDEQYDRPINIISTNSHTSMDNSSLFAPPPPAGQESEDGGALELKTKHLSLDSAYTSEADLDSSHNTTATNSGTVSPKDPEVSEKVLNGHISGLPPSQGLNEEQLISTFSEASRSAEQGVIKSLLPTIPPPIISSPAIQTS